jgi:hypothetical protein
MKRIAGALVSSYLTVIAAADFEEAKEILVSSELKDVSVCVPVFDDSKQLKGLLVRTNLSRGVGFLHVPPGGAESENAWRLEAVDVGIAEDTMPMPWYDRHSIQKTFEIMRSPLQESPDQPELLLSKAESRKDGGYLLEMDRLIFDLSGKQIAVRKRSVQSHFSRAARVQPMDFDGDGDLDIVAYGSGFSRFLNLGAAEFQIAPEVPLPKLARSARDTYLVGNINGDAHLDVFVYLARGSWIGWLELPAKEGEPVKTHRVFERRRNWSTERTSKSHHWYYARADNIREMKLVDLDNDGDDDLAGWENDGDSPFWLENTGKPGIWPCREIPTQTDPRNIRFADFDADGDIDILPALGGQDADESKYWIENLGGAKEWREHYELVGIPLTTADLNGDKVPDRIVWRAPFDDDDESDNREKDLLATRRGIYWISGKQSELSDRAEWAIGAEQSERPRVGQLQATSHSQ